MRVGLRAEPGVIVGHLGAPGLSDTQEELLVFGEATRRQDLFGVLAEVPVGIEREQNARVVGMTMPMAPRFTGTCDFTSKKGGRRMPAGKTM